MSLARFTPKRPIKSFQDLEIYQKLLGVSVAVVKRLVPAVIARIRQPAETKQSQNNEIATASTIARPRNDITVKLAAIALDLPVKIATAHSYRFSDKPKSIAILEEVMLGTNILIVYLEQYRDIENTDIEIEFFEEQITSLLSCRWKTMHLARSWEKFSQTI